MSKGAASPKAGSPKKDVFQLHVEHSESLKVLQAMLAASHPNLLNVSSYTNKLGVINIVVQVPDLQYMTLVEHITLYGPLSESMVKRALQQLVSVMEYCSKLGIYHGYIDPTNILIKTKPELHLVVKLFGVTQISPKLVTNERNRKPSFICMSCVAPELLSVPYQHSKENNPASPPNTRLASPQLLECADCWSLGVSLYFMLTGESPFNEAAVHSEILNVSLLHLMNKFDINDKPAAISNLCWDLVGRLIQPIPTSRLCLEFIASHEYLNLSPLRHTKQQSRSASNPIWAREERKARGRSVSRSDTKERETLRSPHGYSLPEKPPRLSGVYGGPPASANKVLEIKSQFPCEKVKPLINKLLLDAKSVVANSASGFGNSLSLSGKLLYTSGVFGLSVKDSPNGQPVVNSVDENSIADSESIQAGDIIVNCNGCPVQSSSHFAEQLSLWRFTSQHTRSPLNIDVTSNGSLFSISIPLSKFGSSECNFNLSLMPSNIKHCIVKMGLISGDVSLLKVFLDALVNKLKVLSKPKPKPDEEVLNSFPAYASGALLTASVDKSIYNGRATLLAEEETPAPPSHRSRSSISMHYKRGDPIQSRSMSTMSLTPRRSSSIVRERLTLDTLAGASPKKAQDKHIDLMGESDIMLCTSLDTISACTVIVEALEKLQRRTDVEISKLGELRIIIVSIQAPSPLGVRIEERSDGDSCALLVQSVDEDSPLFLNGVRRGHVIKQWNTTPLTHLSVLSSCVSAWKLKKYTETFDILCEDETGQEYNCKINLNLSRPKPTKFIITVSALNGRHGCKVSFINQFGDNDIFNGVCNIIRSAVNDIRENEIDNI